jgi:hypothetical protein
VDRTQFYNLPFLTDHHRRHEKINDRAYRSNASRALMADASIPTVTLREGPHLNPMGTFTVRRKAAKRSERWYQNIAALLLPSTQAEVIPARKKARLEEPLPAATDQADRETAFPEISIASLLLLHPAAAADNDDGNSDLVTATQPNACVTATGWT